MDFYDNDEYKIEKLPDFNPSFQYSFCHYYCCSISVIMPFFASFA